MKAFRHRLASALLRAALAVMPREPPNAPLRCAACHYRRRRAHRADRENLCLEQRCFHTTEWLARL
jgi:hypothetical protein